MIHMHRKNSSATLCGESIRTATSFDLSAFPSHTPATLALLDSGYCVWCRSKYAQVVHEYMPTYADPGDALDLLPESNTELRQSLDW